MVFNAVLSRYLFILRLFWLFILWYPALWLFRLLNRTYYFLLFAYRFLFRMLHRCNFIFFRIRFVIHFRVWLFYIIRSCIKYPAYCCHDWISFPFCFFAVSDVCKCYFFLFCPDWHHKSAYARKPYWINHIPCRCKCFKKLLLITVFCFIQPVKYLNIVIRNLPECLFKLIHFFRFFWCRLWLFSKQFKIRYFLFFVILMLDVCYFCFWKLRCKLFNDFIRKLEHFCKLWISKTSVLLF